MTPCTTYHHGNKKVKDVPAIFPEIPESINPFDDDFQDKHNQSTVVEDTQDQLECWQGGIIYLGNF